MLALPLNRTVEITRRTPGVSTDELGNEIDDTATVTVRGELQQQNRSEPGTAGELSDTTWLLVLPAGTALDTSDVVTVDEEAYEVVGDPWQAHDLAGAASHVEATLRKTG